MATNRTLIYKDHPVDMPVPGKHLVVEDRPVDLDSVPAGGIIVKILYASFDPYQRGRMRDPSKKSYFPPFEQNAAVTNSVVGRVFKSNSPDFSPEDLVAFFGPTAEYAVIAEPAKSGVSKVANPHNFDPAFFIGPLGMPGITAYSGLYKIGKPKAGETIFISSAAGAVGQVVGMIAKREGLKVIGSVGSDAKLDFIIKELGFDAGFNYKKESPFDALPRLAPNGIDIYFENVGGDHLEAALDNINRDGRIPVCGMIADYNTPKDQLTGVKNLFQLVAKTVTMQGFLQAHPDFAGTYMEEFQKNMQKWIAEGSFKPKLHVTEGIDKAPEGLVGIFKGENFGKAVVKISN